MKGETAPIRSLPKSIRRARARLNAETFVTVLMIWAASLPGFASGRGTPEKAASFGPKACAPGPWMVLMAARDGNHVDAMLGGLESLEYHFPFVRSLMDREKLAEADVPALRELLQALAGIAPDDPRALHVVEHCAEREMRECGGKSDMYPLSKAVARSMEALLNPGGGPVCELWDGVWSFPPGYIAEPGTFGDRNGRTGNGLFDAACRMYRLAGGYATPEPAPETSVHAGGRGGGKFEYILANPPFNVSFRYDDAFVKGDSRLPYGIPPRSNANFAWLQFVLADLRENGKAAVVLPTSTLISLNRCESGIRRKIVESGVVEAIMTLPPGLFLQTRISVCVWMVDKARRGKADKSMLFLDAERLEPKIHKHITREQVDLLVQAVSAFREERAPGHAWSAVATLGDIAAQDYILSPNLYIRTGREPAFLTEDEPPDFALCLAELEKHTAGKALAARLELWTQEQKWAGGSKAPLSDLYDIFGGLRAPKKDFGEGNPLLDVKTIVRHPFLPHLCSPLVRVSPEQKETYSIRRGDVIINRTSESLKELGCACVALEGSQAVYTGFAKRLRPRYPDRIVPAYAAAYFRSGLYRRQVLRNVPLIPVSRASLNNRHLERMYVYYPSQEQQQKIGEAFYELFVPERDADPEFQKLLTKARASFLERAISRCALCWEASQKGSEAL